MSFLATEPDDAGPVAELYAADRDRLGYVANYTRLFALRPRVYRAWQELNAAIKETMDLRRYELVTLAAARTLRSSYCALAHGSILAQRFLAPEVVRALANGQRPADIDARDAAAMDLAEQVVKDATAITRADVERLRALGLADEEILDVVLAAAVRCFFSKTLDALGAPPDPQYATLEPELRDALTVGRPLAGAAKP